MPNHCTPTSSRRRRCLGGSNGCRRAARHQAPAGRGTCIFQTTPAHKDTRHRHTPSMSMSKPSGSATENKARGHGWVGTVYRGGCGGAGVRGCPRCLHWAMQGWRRVGAYACVSKRSVALMPSSNRYALSPPHSVLCTYLHGNDAGRAGQGRQAGTAGTPRQAGHTRHAHSGSIGGCD